MAVQFAKAMSAEIYVFSTSPNKKDHIFKNLFLNITHFKLLQFFKYGRGLARFFQFLHPLSGGSSKLTSKSISSCEISVLILNG